MTGARSSKPVIGAWARSTALLLGLSLCAALAVGPAAAEKLGVAAAVNPDAFSSLSGAPKSQLNIGKSIFYNERINTTDSGLVQVLLVDGSTFTVGPGSDLVIDKFVYDPKKGVGQISASFSKGVMRFVGGKISKNEGGVNIDTPAGALAIRGGMVQGNGQIWSFLYGQQMTLKGNNGQTYTVYEPGYTLDLSGGTPNIRPTTAADTNSLMASLTNSNNSGLNNSTETQTGNQIQTTETISLQDLLSDISDVNTQEITNTDTETTEPTEPNQPNEPQPTQVTARVLVGPGVYTAFPGTPEQFTTDDGTEAGILGGDPYSTVDDFIWTFGIENGRLVGTVSGLTDAHCASGDCNNIQTSVITPAAVNFPATFAGCQNGVCAVTDATVTQGGEPTNYIGQFVGKQGFFAYDLIAGQFDDGQPIIDDDSERILAFGGTGYNFGTPSGKTYAFALTPDFKEALDGAIGPFAGAGSSPFVDTSKDENGNFIKPQPAISPLLYLEKDSASANDPSRAVWLQTTLYINTTPAGPETPFDQQSFVNVALGGIDPATGGLIGARRGGAHVDFYQEFYGNCGNCLSYYDGYGYQGTLTRESFAFTGDIATLAGPDGSHFMGSDNPNIVIGFDTTGTHNIGRDIPLDPDPSSVEDQSGSTHHIGVGVGTLPPQGQTLSGEYKGYAAGMVQSEVPQSNFINVVASLTPDDLVVNFNPTTNTLSADISVFDVQNGGGATNAYHIGLGDDSESPADKSAYIDNLHYAAIESGPTSTTVKHGEGSTWTNATSTAYLVSGDQLNVTSFFPDTFAADSNGYRPFCTNCEFLQWGAWGARVEFSNGESAEDHHVDNIHLGWWVSGEPTTVGQIDALAQTGATATYTGHAIGNVANNLSGSGWQTYVAAGNLNMTWNFGPRTGNLTISQFDTQYFGGNGLSFSGAMCAPGVSCGTGINVAAGNHFGGPLSGQLPGGLGSLSGNAAGSFVNNGPNPAAGVIGNWNVGHNDYKAGGIFAGSGTPVPGPN